MSESCSNSNEAMLRRMLLQTLELEKEKDAEIAALRAENARLTKEVTYLTVGPHLGAAANLRPGRTPDECCSDYGKRLNKLEARPELTEVREGLRTLEGFAKRLDRLEEWQNRHHNDTGPLELAGKVKELEAALGAPHSALPLNTQVFNMSERVGSIGTAVTRLENEVAGSAHTEGSGDKPAAEAKGEYANFDRINEVEANLDLAVGRADRHHESISRIERWMNACIDNDEPPKTGDNSVARIAKLEERQNVLETYAKRLEDGYTKAVQQLREMVGALQRWKDETDGSWRPATPQFRSPKQADADHGVYSG